MLDIHRLKEEADTLLSMSRECIYVQCVLSRLKSFKNALSRLRSVNNALSSLRSAKNVLSRAEKGQ
jgi:hypothetical protein